jgi:hypothetical protein
MRCSVYKNGEALMSVFLSWAGKRSHAVAQLFQRWLPYVIQTSDPWLSSASIKKGSSWPDDLQQALQKANGVGIFFVTPAALRSQWMLFEAGRVAALGHRRVCAIRIGLDRLDPPLGLYQHTSLERDDLQRLCIDLNEVLETGVEAAVVERAFNWAWQDFEAGLVEALKVADDEDGGAPVAAAVPEPGVEAVVLKALDRVEARLGGLEERLAATDRTLRRLSTADDAVNLVLTSSPSKGSPWSAVVRSAGRPLRSLLDPEGPAAENSWVPGKGSPLAALSKAPATASRVQEEPPRPNAEAAPKAAAPQKK